MSAKHLFHAKDKEFSKAEEKSISRESIVYNTTEDILVFMEDTNVTKNELARRLGKSKSYVSQVLSGARNMTLGTLSDIAFELGLAVKVQFRNNAENSLPTLWSDVPETNKVYQFPVGAKKLGANDSRVQWTGESGHGNWVNHG